MNRRPTPGWRRGSPPTFLFNSVSRVKASAVAYLGDDSGKRLSSAVSRNQSMKLVRGPVFSSEPLPQSSWIPTTRPMVAHLDPVRLKLRESLPDFVPGGRLYVITEDQYSFTIGDNQADADSVERLRTYDVLFRALRERSYQRREAVMSRCNNTHGHTV